MRFIFDSILICLFKLHYILFLFSLVIAVTLEVQFKPDKPVFVMSWEGKNPKLPSILLNSHVDVVPVFAVSVMSLHCLYVYVSGILCSVVIGWKKLNYQLFNIMMVRALFDATEIL